MRSTRLYNKADLESLRRMAVWIPITVPMAEALKRLMNGNDQLEKIWTILSAHILESIANINIAVASSSPPNIIKSCKKKILH